MRKLQEKFIDALNVAHHDPVGAIEQVSPIITQLDSVVVAAKRICESAHASHGPGGKMSLVPTVLIDQLLTALKRLDE